MIGNDQYKYATYRPTEGYPLVKSAVETIQTWPGGEGLYAAVDTYLICISLGDHQAVWKNDTNQPIEYKHNLTTAFTILSGNEIATKVGIAAAYDGLHLTVDHQEKVFQASETTTTRTHTINVIVPPHSSSYLYQKRYTFRSDMFFILDAWGQGWNVGSLGGYDIVRKDCKVEIMSNDYVSLETKLDGGSEGDIKVKRVERTTVEIDRETRKLNECTRDSKDVLVEMGIDAKPGWPYSDPYGYMP